MRATSSWALVGAALILLNGHSSAEAARKSKPAPRVAVQRGPVPTEIIDGYGETAEKARDQALQRAIKRTEELIVERFSLSDWRPTVEQMDPEYLARLEVITPLGPPEPAGVKGEPTLVARYRVGLTPAYLSEVVREARLQRAQDRHLILARVLGAILVVALVTAGYLRLEEWTKGYATKLLRLAAVVLLALTALGLWLTA